MKQKITLLFTCLFMFLSLGCAAQNEPNFAAPPPPRFDHKKMEEFNQMLITRLNLTQKQQEQITKYHNKHREQMHLTMEKMRALHEEISKIYLTEGISKYEADIRTIPQKTELALLQQSAHRQKLENRKKFESILDKNQKAEFEKIKQELREKRKANRPEPPRD